MSHLSPATVRVLTGTLIVLTAIGWIAWDLYVANVPSGTESETIRRWAAHPLVPFALGVLMGHFFGIQWRPGD